VSASVCFRPEADISLIKKTWHEAGSIFPPHRELNQGDLCRIQPRNATTEPNNQNAAGIGTTDD